MTRLPGVPLEPWLELALLAAAGLPLVRLLSKRPVRREARAHPMAAIALAAVASAALAVAAWSAARSPRVLRSATVISLVVAAAVYVRARPAYGARRQLPPGPLGLAASLDAITREDFYALAAQRWGPVSR